LTVAPLCRPLVAMPRLRRAGLVAALAAAPFALAYRFALVYRVRAGFPQRRPPASTPAALGLPFETITVDAPGATLAGWFIPARGGALGPGVALVHGWESARDRTLPMASFLHAAGFHCLTVDVRGHGANRAEVLPISGGEFGTDALAAFEALLARPEVSKGAISGHSMGGIGAILAAAADRRVAALVATSSPSEPYRLTRQTFRLARLPIPDLVAYPLAWVTTRVYLRPRGHTVPAISASAAIARYRGPVLLVHGDADDVVPLAHMERLARIARASRAGQADAERVESVVIPGGRHSWLYEFPAYRSAVARFLAETLGGTYPPDVAAERAAAVPAKRVTGDGDSPTSAIAAEPGGFRSLAGVAAPGATSRRAADPDETGLEAPPVRAAEQ
jgi:alpha-beta hydrolase superfamily lysophospholipase